MGNSREATQINNASHGSYEGSGDRASGSNFSDTGGGVLGGIASGGGFFGTLVSLFKGTPATAVTPPPGLFDNEKDNTVLYAGLFLLLFMSIVLFFVFKSKSK